MLDLVADDSRELFGELFLAACTEVVAASMGLR